MHRKQLPDERSQQSCRLPGLSRRRVLVGAAAYVLGEHTVSSFQSPNASAQSAARHFGLFVGINEYESRDLNPLNFCVNDATEMHAELCNSTTGLIKSGDALLLTDKDAKKERILNEIERIVGSLSAADAFTMYWACHGARPERDKEEMYLVAADTKIINRDTRDLENAIRFIAEIMPILEKKNNFMTLIVDGCRVGDALARPIISRNENVAIISATKKDEDAIEDDRLKHGVFTYHLLQSLRSSEADADQDGFVSVEEAHAFSYKPVLEYVAKYHAGQRQYPTVAGNNIHKIQIARKADTHSTARLKSKDWKTVEQKSGGTTRR